jgi:hypothetical protein
MRTRLTILLLLTLCALPFYSSAAKKAPPINSSTAYFYVEVETKVYRKGVEISSENPSERPVFFKRCGAARRHPLLLSDKAKDHALLQPPRDGSV